MSQLQNFVQEPNLMGAPWISPIDPKWAEHQREMELIEARARADIMKAQMRSELNLQEAERLLRLREDVREEAACFTERFAISEDGELQRKKMFLLRPAAKYVAGNFRVVGRPRLLTAAGVHGKLIFVRLRVGEKEETMTIDLRSGSPNYVARKFREVGAHIRLKRGETNEIYLRLIEFLQDQAEVCIVPHYRGFIQTDGIERLQYVDENTLIWEDFENEAQ